MYDYYYHFAIPQNPITPNPDVVAGIHVVLYSSVAFLVVVLFAANYPRIRQILSQRIYSCTLYFITLDSLYIFPYSHTLPPKSLGYCAPFPGRGVFAKLRTGYDITFNK